MARNRVSSAPIISAYPAYRWHSPRPQQSGATAHIAGLNLVRDVLGSELGVVTIECVKLPDGPVRHAVGSDSERDKPGQDQAGAARGERSARLLILLSANQDYADERARPQYSRRGTRAHRTHEACGRAVGPDDSAVMGEDLEPLTFRRASEAEQLLDTTSHG